MTTDGLTKTLIMIKFEEFRSLISLTRENKDLDSNNNQISSFDNKNLYSKTDQYIDCSSKTNQNDE